MKKSKTSFKALLPLPSWEVERAISGQLALPCHSHLFILWLGGGLLLYPTLMEVGKKTTLGSVGWKGRVSRGGKGVEGGCCEGEEGEGGLLLI